jgi:uncharacterized membrane protein YagU involved in acid resistance
MGLGRAIVGGVAGGTVGAALMLPLFEGAKRAGLVPETPPKRVVDRAAETAAEATEAGGPVEEGERTAAAAGSHLLYGAAAGALYGLIQDELRLPAALAGPVYGLVVWAAGYLGWMPASGVLPQPWRQQAGEALVPVVAHVVYGATLGAVERVIRRD